MQENNNLPQASTPTPVVTPTPNSVPATKSVFPKKVIYIVIGIIVVLALGFFIKKTLYRPDPTEVMIEELPLPVDPNFDPSEMEAMDFSGNGAEGELENPVMANDNFEPIVEESAEEELIDDEEGLFE